MKHPEYDSPFELVMSDITTQMAQDIDEMCWKAIQKVGINVDKEKLLIALRQDAGRYREAYANGYDTGYEKRDDEIVRCKECKHGGMDSASFPQYWCSAHTEYVPEDYYCATGEREEGR